MTPLENIKQIIAHDITSHDQIEEVRKILDLKEIDLNYPNTKGEL